MTISNQINERVNLITAIINRKQAINRITFNSTEWHTQFNALYSLHIDKLKAFIK